MYNQVRAKRPLPTGSQDIFKWVDQISDDTMKSCDFCNYNQLTATDLSGR